MSLYPRFDVAEKTPTHGAISWAPGTPPLRRLLRRVFPSRVKLQVPTLTTDLKNLDLFMALRTKIDQPAMDVLFDFSECKDLSAAGLAFLGGLARLVEKSDGNVRFDWQTCSAKVRRLLQRSGFEAHFGGRPAERDPHIIPYREDAGSDAVSLGRYLRESWLSEQWIFLSPGLREALVVVALEIYLNAFEHGGSPIGVISCGRHMEKSKTLRLTVLDFGVSIPWNVRNFTNRPNLRAATAMKWAFQQGSTTKPIPDTVRGIGLDLLKDFVRLNHGQVRVASAEGLAVIKGQTQRFRNLPTPFHGTLVDIMFRCDDARYALVSEVETGRAFFR